MSYQEAVVKACSLDGQPLSGRSLAEIVATYKDCPDLLGKIQQPEAEQDFSTKFIKTHEDYIQLNSKGFQKLRVCHNLGEANDDENIFLLIHGLGGNLEQFEPLLKLIDENNKKFLCLDLPGFGKSDEWDKYPMIDVIDVIHEVVCMFGGEHHRSLTIIGHSMGCYISLHFYQIYASIYLINKIILLSPPRRTVDQLAKNNYLIQLGLLAGYKLPWIFDLYRGWFDQYKGLASSGIKQFFYRHGDITNQYRKLWQFHNNVKIKSRSIFGYLLGWESIKWDKVCVELTDSKEETTVLIMCGDKDIVTPIEYSEGIYESLTGVVKKKLIVLIDCGHNVCFDNPEEVCTKIYKYLF